jgi:hypothetical protein
LHASIVPGAHIGKNGRHALAGLFRQSVFGRLAGYESDCAASPSQMGRFETQLLAAEKNLSSLADLAGQWIDRIHARRPPRGIVLDTDSSVGKMSIFFKC